MTRRPGEMLGSMSIFPDGPESDRGYPQGIWADPDGSVWVVGRGATSALMHLSATGSEIGRYPLADGISGYGLVRLADGRFAMLDSSDWLQANIVTLDIATGATTRATVSGLANPGEAGFQLNLTPDGRLLWADRDKLRIVSVDGVVVESYDIGDTANYAVIGADGLLYSANQNGDIEVRSLDDLAAPGRRIAERGVVYAPTQPMSTTAIAVAADSTVYSLGYFYGDQNGVDTIDPFRGIVALGQIWAPIISSTSASMSALACQPIATAPLVATGTPPVSQFEIVDGVLPAGLAFDETTGAISGTAFQPADISLVVRALNGVSPTPGTTADTVVLSLSVSLGQFTDTSVTIAGDAEVGALLTAETTSWQPAPQTRSLQWLRDDVLIADATGSTYRVRDEDAGHELTARVTGTADCTAAATGVSAPRLISVVHESTPTPTPSADPASTLASTPSGNPSSTLPARLASTGNEAGVSIFVAITLLGIGTLVLIARRRRVR
ncbi:LPXTG cell wall anchor domain-containing protein [Microbacterium sp. SORGH_AS_0862]|uniref:LPXTG cell wall anchor domain-containing protein n=1 Tax=Microbacterium sp. SORGH_AS_0862 TaxID=3041789 RepID=UPI002791EF0D|nr:LPXTG cell wall anchor domain-containing protein [Microbacterium sp. SORGH_AS_0862]MDQ1204623.1 LPXTG-motif cell wall-anchored protein [Microbacterium sp. SORGH_AS_0862]